jgi:hypothetical protein
LQNANLIGRLRTSPPEFQPISGMSGGRMPPDALIVP